MALYSLYPFVQAPSILITMINMFLSFGASPTAYSVSTPETNPLFGDGAEPQVGGHCDVQLCPCVNCVDLSLLPIVLV